MLELARESDWDAIRRLSVQIHDLHVSWRPDIYCHSDEPYAKGQFLEDIRSRMVYVAKLQQTVVGYTVLSIREKTGPGIVEKKEMLISSICVDESLRKHGIGKEMMTDIQALARAFRCNSLILGVHPENDSAIAFYQKCGFALRTVNMELKP